MKELVISGINLIDGGALSIYYDLLDSLLKHKYYEKYKIVALISEKKFFEKYTEHIEFIEFPKSKKKWLYRLYYEFFYFKKFSKNRNIDIWLSLHDITPNVVAKKQFVYCHNPSPFNKMKLSDAKYGFKYYLFSKFYKYLYRINIKKNTAVIVQQEWIRKEFENMFKINNVIVARPSFENNMEFNNIVENCKDNIFIYPSFPRYYKNFEVVCEAANILKKLNVDNFKVILTIDGTENLYAKNIYKKYKDNANIDFIGIQPREELYELYSKATCLIFMSKLETWGMPIIEYKGTNKSMIVANLPYARETVDKYEHVSFVDVDNANELAEKMNEVIKKGIINERNEEMILSKTYCTNWKDLLQMIL